MRSSKATKSLAAPRVIAGPAARVSDEVAKDALAAVTRYLSLKYPDNPQVRSMQFVPSTRVALRGKPGYEVLANTTVEFGSGSGLRKKRVIESVIKVSDANGKQSLDGVTVPGI